MCKIMCIAGVDKSKVKNLQKFMAAMVAPLTASDPHGFGYAAISASTGLYGERWLSPADAFKTRKDVSPNDAPLLAHLGAVLEPAITYNSFGTASGEDIQAVLLHGRYATCDVSIANTHPFVRGTTALIHNGVISNSYQLKKITSTCDSEVILNEYVESNVSVNADNIQDVAYSLEGYYACGVLARGASGHWIMDVFRDDKAELYCTFVKELGTTVFCTSDSILRAIWRLTGFTTGTVFKVRDNKLIRLDVETGKCFMQIDFESTFETNSPGQDAYDKCQTGISLRECGVKDSVTMLEDYRKRYGWKG